MTTPGVSEAAPLLAYAAPSEAEGRGRVLRRVMVIVLILALLAAAWGVIGCVRWGLPFSQWVGLTPPRIAEQCFMRILIPLFNLALAMVMIRGLRCGKLSNADKVFVWSGVVLYMAFAGVLAWLVATLYPSLQIQSMSKVAGNQARHILPLLLLLAYSARQRRREMGWKAWGPALGCVAVLLVPVFWFWLTSFQDGQREVIEDLSRRSRAGNLGIVRAVGQMTIYAGLVGFVAMGLVALVYTRGIPMMARAFATMMLAGLTLRADETIYIYCLGTFGGNWELYSHLTYYTANAGGLTLPFIGGDGFKGVDLAALWWQSMSDLFTLFAFAVLCRMAVPRPNAAIGPAFETPTSAGR